MVAVLQYRRIALAGHIWRSNNLMISVLKWKPNEKIPLGRPKQQKWIDKVKNNLAEIGIQLKKYYHRIETGGNRFVLR